MAGLQKVEVAPGITWVEVPEADVRVLCGCPADSVKHLMRRGLIVTREQDGIRCESGPNAILLSDVMLQHGHFANLSEFPVLQMLYRQGMLLPGHPNNTGEKPLLIGSRTQDAAQMDYICRGNYGLVSEEEMISAGADPETARELMSLKLRFAFGEIKRSSALLDNRIVDDGRIEIRNGVYVERHKLNGFTFTWKDSSVDVDLNLQPGEQYQAAYPLSFHKIKRESFSIIHSGEGDGWDVNRPTMGSILMYQGRLYLVDTGPNIEHTLDALGISVREIEGIFHTHCHDDHFCGLPTFMRSDHRIKYFAHPLVRASVIKKLAALVSIRENQFEDFFEVHDLELDVWNNVEGLEVRPLMSPHPVENTIFQFRAAGQNGKQTYAHYADIVSLKVLENMITDDTDSPGVSQELYDRVKAQYLEPATVKKLDVGGGLIHGDANDFIGDKSKKIILSHTANPLTAEQREVGSEAPFGIVNKLIPSYQDFVWRYAFEYLRDYFPGLPQHAIRTLLNNEVVTFDPKTIVMREGQEVEHVYMILTGSTEALTTSRSTGTRHLSAGNLLAEIAGLHHLPCMATYRANCFVDALAIPIEMYREMVEEFGLFPKIAQLMEGREFLRDCKLFSYGLSYPLQNQLAENLNPLCYPAGNEVPVADTKHLLILRRGKAELCRDGTESEKLMPGNFCGEDVALFDLPLGYSLRSTVDTEFCRLPIAMLRDIPIVHWKLLESFQRRRRMAGNAQLEAA